jgi:RNA polymerase sigma factor (sigma-70 family)
MMKAFLYHVLNNLVIDQYRKQKTTSLDLLAENGFELSINPSTRLYQFLDGKTAILLIHKLPHMYRKVMYMRYVQNLSIEEMALATGQSKNSLTVQAHRGLEKLKTLYHRT